MRALDESTTDVYRRGVPGIDAKRAKAGCRANDVSNGIDGADFVEVHCIHGDVMNFCFDVREQFEGAQR